jgi:DNA-binding PadR family transcriptional regulator
MREKRDFLGGLFEELVLLAIDGLGENAYGVTIREAIELRAERPTSYGAIYATLDRLEKKGYVTSILGEATAERGGRAKKYYRLAAAGVKAIDDTQRARKSLSFGFEVGHDPIAGIA